MRVALRLAYLGQGYYGFQSQPQVPTVEGVVRRGLSSLGLAESGFCYAGRTDRGVSALGQVISFHVDEDQASLAVPRVINTRLPWNVWTWAWALVPEDFSARYGAVWRKYRYVLCRHDLDLDLMQKAAQNLMGTHDFRNFSAEKKRGTVKTLISLDIREHRGGVIIEAKADGFLWNMVRKIVTALEMVGSGKKTVDWVQDLLNPQLNQGVAAAPPEGLVFLDVGYGREIDWDEDLYSKKIASARLSKALVPQKALTESMGEILKSMS